MKTILPILEKLIAFPTDIVGANNSKITSYITHLLAQHNMPFWLIPTLKGQNNILGYLTPDLPPVGGLVLSGHIDTVGVSKNWQTPPFKLTAQGNKLYGRGVVDMKAFSAVILGQLSFLKQSKMPIYLMLSCDEETDMQGIGLLINTLKQKNFKPLYALVGEPSNLSLGQSSKGFNGFQTYCAGISGHSSMPFVGVNAISVAAKFINAIENLNAKYMHLGNTFNVGVVKGGKETNSIPDSCDILWEMRTTKKSFQKEIQSIIQKEEKDILKNYPKASITTKIQDKVPVFEKENDAFFNALNKQFLTPIIQLPYATEAGFLQEQGMKVLICGPGDEKLAHTTGEYLEMENLNQYIAFFKNFISFLPNMK